MENQDNSSLTCSGSIRLGNGCGTCSKCKKEYEEINNEHESNKNTNGLTGWICPKCGGCNSPFNNRCMCVPIEWYC